ncbi:MAG: TlpA disulfide reductase family protein [Pseudomonadota bacterium]
MRSLRILLALSVLLLLPQAMALGEGSVVPQLSAPAGDGSTLSLEQFRGQVVYVDFWASWCAPCRQAIPALDTLHQRYKAQGFTVLGVNVDTDRKSAQRMIDQLVPKFPIVFDPKGQWPEAFGLQDMPSSFLIDAKGVVRFVKKGFRERDVPQIEAAIKAVLGEKP